MAAPSELRLAFWTELADYVRSMSIAPADVLAPAGLGNYLRPRETEAPVRSALVRALVHGGLSREHAPFLYWVAIHHLAPTVGRDASEAEPNGGGGLSVQQGNAALLLLTPPQATVDWLSYDQPAPPAAVQLPPACYGVCRDLEARAAAIAAGAGVTADWEARLTRDAALATLLRSPPSVG